MSSTRVLITGASGLLGRHLYREFSSSAEWEVLGLAYSRARGDLRKTDITKLEEIQKVLEEFKPSVIIHSAAERKPDIVENQEEATRRLNVEATRNFCEEAKKIGAYVVYISTDYVFDGKNPPYGVDHPTNPLNKYGQSKLDGEKVVLDVSQDNVILRVPILYGEIEALDESAVTTLFSKVKDTSAKCIMSDYERRYPTHCADVAWVLKELILRRMKDSTLNGIFHWSGDENMTKYDMAIAMATSFNISTDQIVADKNPSGGAPRPYDAHLDPSRVEDLGICKRMPFKEGIVSCLTPHIN